MQEWSNARHFLVILQKVWGLPNQCYNAAARWSTSRRTDSVAVLSDSRIPAKAVHLPDASEFPREPATWYVFCTSADLKKKPLSKRMLGRRLVAYRTDRGDVTVLDAHCTHLGADLGRGTVVGDTIRCPFHHWRYASDGRCAAAAGCERPPKSAKLRCYPAIERHGYVFFFNGPEPLFQLPFFPDCDEDAFAASARFRFEMDCPWFMLVANGFDGQHFQAVHDRKLTSAPTVDCPGPFARRMQFKADVMGTTLVDRLLRRFVGKHVEISITSWGGPHVLVEGRFGRAHSRLLVASQALGADRTLSDVIVFARRVPMIWGGRLSDAVNLSVRRMFTQAFVRYDIDRLSGVRYQPEGLIEQDRELIECFHWLGRLPRSEYDESAE